MSLWERTALPLQRFSCRPLSLSLSLSGCLSETQIIDLLLLLAKRKGVGGGAEKHPLYSTRCKQAYSLCLRQSHWTSHCSNRILWVATGLGMVPIHHVICGAHKGMSAFHCLIKAGGKTKSSPPRVFARKVLMQTRPGCQSQNSYQLVLGAARRRETDISARTLNF